MSRRIVQIAAVSSWPGAGDVVSTTELFALDNNGVAWVMVDPDQSKKWQRLPELPSVDTRPRISPTREQLDAALVDQLSRSAEE